MACQAISSLIKWLNAVVIVCELRNFTSSSTEQTGPHCETTPAQSPPPPIVMLMRHWHCTGPCVKSLQLMSERGSLPHTGRALAVTPESLQTETPPRASWRKKVEKAFFLSP